MQHSIIGIGVDSRRQPGHAPPIIRMGANHLFPPIIRGEFFENHKRKQRQRNKNRKESKEAKERGKE